MQHVPYEASDLLTHSSIVHGFFGRVGGVSDGDFASLNINLHNGDDEQNVVENRARIAHAMGIELIVTLRQVHKNDVLVVDEKTENGHQMDAMVTKIPGRLLAIQTADCTPILLADHVSGVIGAVHAGWRSAVAGIVEKTVQAMESLGAKKEHIAAVVGPTIHQANYEVGQEVFDAANAPEFFASSIRPSHYFFDLPGYVLSHLKLSGINTTEALPYDTYALDDQYFSYRRSCHRQDSSWGGQLSVIGLR